MQTFKQFIAEAGSLVTVIYDKTFTTGTLAGITVRDQKMSNFDRSRAEAFKREYDGTGKVQGSAGQKDATGTISNVRVIEQ